MTRHFLIFLILVSTSIVQVKAQTLRQIIRGKVIDKDSGLPIIGATLVINNSDPLIGVSTDVNGEFEFIPLRVGRYDIRIQCIGFESKIVSNVLLRIGKESELSVFLTESILLLDEVTIKAKKHKSEPLNKMAVVSARSFTVEETNRYAGSFDDPARMASSFAGVMSNPDGGNDIIIRGNSPTGLLWRMEGIEIPNPNHFANEGSSGGAISALNSKMLDNSDFYTGAFPAEYGNAYSGVFDLRLRNGNKHKREYSLMAGVIGTDVTAEGPFKKGANASYLFNYRYSTLALLDALGLNTTGDVLPKFQNSSFKINIPTKKAGTFSLFGLGGLSGIKDRDEGVKVNFNTGLAVLGLSHTIPIDDKTLLKSVLAYSGSRNNFEYQDSLAPGIYRLEREENMRYTNLSGSTSINRKLNSKHSIKTGVIFSKKLYNVVGKQWNFDDDYYETVVNRKGNTEIFQAYLSWKFRFGENLTLISGLHYSRLFLNNNDVLEPRTSFSWEFDENKKLSLGFGVHSRIASLTNYLAQRIDEQGNVFYPNQNLDFTKARHYVIGYEQMFGKNLLLKLEAYYQDLFDVPVENDPLSSISSLNYISGYTNDIFVNEGTGTNYGIDFTLEKFFSKNYYFLITTSLFDSKYIAKDKIERNTRFNNKYLFNALGGKEWKLKDNGIESSLVVSSRVIFNGGLWYTPIDVAASLESGNTKYDESMRFATQRDDFLRIDLKIQYRKNKKKTTRIWELDIQNITNQQNVIYQSWNKNDKAIENTNQFGLLPVLSYRIEF